MEYFTANKLFGIIRRDPETVPVPPTTTRIPGGIIRTGTEGLRLLGLLLTVRAQSVRTIYVRNDKPVDSKSKDPLINGLELSLSSDLALYSCIAKASTAQTIRDADPKYPGAYPSQREDVISAGIRPLYMPPDARYVTSTGAPFDQKDRKSVV